MNVRNRSLVERSLKILCWLIGSALVLTAYVISWQLVI